MEEKEDVEDTDEDEENEFDDYSDRIYGTLDIEEDIDNDYEF